MMLSCVRFAFPCTRMTLAQIEMNVQHFSHVHMNSMWIYPRPSWLEKGVQPASHGSGALTGHPAVQARDTLTFCLRHRFLDWIWTADNLSLWNLKQQNLIACSLVWNCSLDDWTVCILSCLGYRIWLGTNLGLALNICKLAW